MNADVVDFAFGTGVTSYLNLSGIGKIEKSMKVARYGEILKEIRNSAEGNHWFILNKTWKINNFFTDK